MIDTPKSAESVFPETIGRLHLSDKLSDGERFCAHSHDIAEGHPVYWPQALGQYDDIDPYCLAHAIEQAESDSGWCETCIAASFVTPPSTGSLATESAREPFPFPMTAFYDTAFKDGRDDDYNPDAAIARHAVCPPFNADRKLAPAMERLRDAVHHYRNNQDEYQISLPRSGFAGKDDWAPWFAVRHLREILEALTTQSDHARGLEDPQVVPAPGEVEGVRKRAQSIWDKRWFCVEGEWSPDEEPIETDEPRRFAEIAIAALILATVAAANDEGVTLDWRAVAKLAREHGVRYRTNTALEKFLAAIRLLPKGPAK
jgi:hypothetical protein